MRLDFATVTDPHHYTLYYDPPSKDETYAEILWKVNVLMLREGTLL